MRPCPPKLTKGKVQMKRMKVSIVTVISLLAALLPVQALAQSEGSSDETRDLRRLVEEMRIQMSRMQEEIDQLKAAKAKADPSQREASATLPVNAPEQTIQTQSPLPQSSQAFENIATTAAAPVDHTGNPKASDEIQARNGPAGVLTEQQPPAVKPGQVEEELQRGPEIADVTPTTPALELGPAKIRLIGYPALTTVWRSTNNGGNVATNFNNLPFDNTPPGTTSEFRLSPQNTRLALRVDADLKSSDLAGYFEMDFVGSPVGGNLVTQSGYPFRLRQAWLDWRKGKWELTGGQLWSLMTPNKDSISPWPGDVAVTQVIDLNFVAGLVVGRYPQFRVVYRHSDKVAFGFSMENPEQQVYSSVVFPSALASTLNTQYNIGNSVLSVPNMTPDFIFKGSFDNKTASDRRIHFDVGTVMRVFRSWDGGSASGKDYAFGWGVGANFNAEITKHVRWVLDGFAGDGSGRYIGGLAPDVIVRADGSISPIHSYSWVTGFEIAPNKATGLYFYYSGLYAQKNAALNSDGTCCVGFGFPGASNAAERLIGELTGGYSRIVWAHEGLGSVQWGGQYAYVWLYPWVAGAGPNSARANMVFAQVRYNLP
jgi:hypothetical protein